MTDEEIPAGDESERGEGERSIPSKADIKLWRRALRENWPISAEDRSQIIRDMMEAFILSNSTRDKINAAKIIMLGDSLNVKRASMIGAANKVANGGTQVNVNVGVQVVESDDWYGTRAAAESRTLATESNGASASSVALPGPVQSGGNGKTLGQNGNGSNGHH